MIQDAGLVIGSGDLVTISVFGTPELAGAYRVDQAGKIVLPVGGQITLLGLTAQDASKVIETRLREGQIMLDPHVTVFVTQYATQGITVAGEVKLAGIYPVFGPHSLFDVLTLAGGTGATSGPTITITHRSDPQHPVVISVDSYNDSEVQRLTPVNPGDTIFVSRAPNIYVVGDVKGAGAFPMPYGKNLHVLTVMALCGGLTLTSKGSKASIIRPTESGGAETIAVDLEKIMKNEAPNITLQASDVLVVPRSGWKSFEQTALPTITSTAVSAGISAAIVR